MLVNGRGLIKALEKWAKDVTAGYRDVEVRDLSTSFRDGLAFCAIINHYRPDLIEFDSLSKENILENNSLAFSVAEKQLGVPALLDAEDMVKYERPDRLSIITYLSQLRNCFENQNKVNKKLDLKRVQKNSSGPPAKISIVTPTLTSPRHEVCQVCKHRVFILERLIVDGKLYHTTCFRCHKCNNLLNPGAYVESDTPGVYECSVCLTDEAPESEESSLDKTEDQMHYEVIEVKQPQVPESEGASEKPFSTSEAINFAKSNLQLSPKTEINEDAWKRSRSDSDTKPNLKRRSEISPLVLDKISAFEKNQVNGRPPERTSAVLPDTVLSFSLSSNNQKEVDKSALPSSESLSPSVSPEKFNGSSETLNSNNKFTAKTAKSIYRKSWTELNAKENHDAHDISSNPNLSSLKMPYSDLRISRSKSSETESDTTSLKTGSESPRVPRDIFKSSFSPLKLNLPSSLRKEPLSSSPGSSDSEKSLGISQIKPMSPVIKPRTPIGKNLSVIKHCADIRRNNSESSFNDSSTLENLQTERRSSLESSELNAKKSNRETHLGVTSKSSQKISLADESNSCDNISVPDSSIESGKSSVSTADRTDEIITDSSYDSHASLAKNTVPQIVCEEKKPSKNEAGSSFDSAIASENSENEQFSKSVSLEPRKDSKIVPDLTVDEVTNSTKSKEEEEDYPDDLNPFGDEENDGDINFEKSKEEEYPDDLNPFGDDTEEINTSVATSIDYDESKNPFASDDEDGEAETSKDTSAYSPRAAVSESKTSSFMDSFSSAVSSPSGSLKGTMKKRPAPRPPNVSDIFPKDSADSGKDSSFNSVKGSPSITKKGFQTSSPKIRKNKPAPPPPIESLSVQDHAASVKMTKDTDNMKIKSSQADDKQQPKTYKKKKRPAPPVPVSIRRDMKKIPMSEIVKEMREIEEKQREYEKQGREIEILIRDRDKDEEASVEEEEYIMQLFELVNRKNALFRRQAELMYIKRSQRLEEQQYQIEKEIRQLMEKPESEKTEEDRQKEEDLTMELIDIVDQRNSIIDSIEMDRRRELEEDHSVQEQLEIKNGDLPITAEIKQKSGKKDKKKKEKKEKKKQAAEEESGKGTLRKKKHLFSKRS